MFPFIQWPPPGDGSEGRQKKREVQDHEFCKLPTVSQAGSVNLKKSERKGTIII